MKRKTYEAELARLHAELVSMQEWVKATGAKVCVVFEGRDSAGKGGSIKAITAKVSPRVFRIVALPSPTEREKSQMYIQRYIPHLPAAGEVVIFDRLQARVDDPRKTWKLSAMDLKSYSRWYDYARARDAMFEASSSEWAPWYVVRTDDKRRGRLNLITHLLSLVPYEPFEPQDVTFPARQDAGDYVEPSLDHLAIPTPF